jgi:hypothetical protein
MRRIEKVAMRNGMKRHIVLGSALAGIAAVGFLAVPAVAGASGQRSVSPATVDWASGVTFGPVGNVGPGALADCAIAAVADIEQVFAQEILPPDPAPYINAYEALAQEEGQQPGPTGSLATSDVLATWKSNGIAGHLATAIRTGTRVAPMKVSLDSGPVFAEVELPPTASTLGTLVNSAGVAVTAWTSSTPPSGYAGSGAHAVAVVGYNASDVLIVTWGYVQPVSWAEWAKLAVAAWSVHPAGRPS